MGGHGSVEPFDDLDLLPKGTRAALTLAFAGEESLSDRDRQKQHRVVDMVRPVVVCLRSCLHQNHPSAGFIMTRTTIGSPISRVGSLDTFVIALQLEVREWVR